MNAFSQLMLLLIWHPRMRGIVSTGSLVWLFQEAFGQDFPGLGLILFVARLPLLGLVLLLVNHLIDTPIPQLANLFETELVLELRHLIGIELAVPEVEIVRQIKRVLKAGLVFDV